MFQRLFRAILVAFKLQDAVRDLGLRLRVQHVGIRVCRDKGGYVEPQGSGGSLGLLGSAC